MENGIPLTRPRFGIYMNAQVDIVEARDKTLAHTTQKMFTDMTRKPRPHTLPCRLEALRQSPRRK